MRTLSELDEEASALSGREGAGRPRGVFALLHDGHSGSTKDCAGMAHRDGGCYPALIGVG